MMKNKLKTFSLLTIAIFLAACAGGQKKTIRHATVKRVPDPASAAHPREPSYVFPDEPLVPFDSRTIDDVLYSYAPYAVHQLRPHFQQAGVAYPPREVTLIALKEERRLELWARDENQREYRFVRNYDIMAASGTNGPKLRQGDKQVPEGIYRIVRLNPNSSFHLSMKLNYPNEFDLFHANREGRRSPGSDIFIHGDSVSAGCLAMGDTVIEELFVLTAHVGKENVKVVIAPHDPRIRPLESDEPGLPSWTQELYEEITWEIIPFATPNPVKLSSNRLPSRPDHSLR